MSFVPVHWQFSGSEARMLCRNPSAPRQNPSVPERYGSAPDNPTPAHKQLQEKKEWFEATRGKYINELMDFKGGFTQEHLDLLKNSKEPWQSFMKEMNRLSQETEHNASLLQEEVDALLRKGEAVLVTLKYVLAAQSDRYDQRSFDEYARDYHWDALLEAGSVPVRMRTVIGANRKNVNLSEIVIPNVPHELQNGGQGAAISQEKPLGTEYVYLQLQQNDRPSLVLKHPQRGVVVMRYEPDRRLPQQGVLRITERKEAPDLSSHVERINQALRKSESLAAPQRVAQIHQAVNEINQAYTAVGLQPATYWPEALARLSPRQRSAVEWVITVESDGSLRATPHDFEEIAQEYDARPLTTEEVAALTQQHGSLEQYEAFLTSKRDVGDASATVEMLRIERYQEEQEGQERERIAKQIVERNMERERDGFGRALGDLVQALNRFDDDCTAKAENAVNQMNSALEKMNINADEYRSMVELYVGTTNYPVFEQSIRIDNGKYALDVEALATRVQEKQVSEPEITFVSSVVPEMPSVVPAVADRSLDFDESITAADEQSQESTPAPMQLPTIDPLLVQTMHAMSHLPASFDGLKESTVQRLRQVDAAAREASVKAAQSVEEFGENQNQEPLAHAVAACTQAYEAMMQMNGVLEEALEEAVTADAHRPIWKWGSGARREQVQALHTAEVQLHDRMRATHTILQSITAAHRADGGVGVLRGLPSPEYLVGTEIDALYAKISSDKKVARRMQADNYIESWAPRVRHWMGR
jgi:hypothetical protein